jgi:hypothetical protein
MTELYTLWTAAVLAITETFPLFTLTAPEKPTLLLRGVVDHVNTRGYAFICLDDGQRVFVPNIHDVLYLPAAVRGTKVGCKAVETGRGLHAAFVKTTADADADDARKLAEWRGHFMRVQMVNAAVGLHDAAQRYAEALRRGGLTATVQVQRDGAMWTVAVVA